jgi:hypothetical protein
MTGQGELKWTLRSGEKRGGLNVFLLLLMKWYVAFRQ